MSGTESVWIRWGEYQPSPSEYFCPRVPKNFVGESFIVALISSMAKVWIRGARGVSRFSVENFSSDSAENFRTGNLCCIIFGYRKSLEKRGGEYQDFSSKIFRLIVPKNSVG